MTKDTTQPLPPLLIMGITTIFMLINILTTNGIFLIPHYLAIGLTILCGGLFFTNRRVYTYVLFVTLILGTVNILSFTASIFTVGFSYSPKIIGTEFNLGLQPLSFVLLLLFAYLYGKGKRTTRSKKLFEKKI